MFRRCASNIRATPTHRRPPHLEQPRERETQANDRRSKDARHRDRHQLPPKARTMRPIVGMSELWSRWPGTAEVRPNPVERATSGTCR